MSNHHLLNWNDLKILDAVIRSANLAEAATILGVNHSTVFRRINVLEQALGVKLFERLADGYQLSALGLDTQEYLEQIVQSVNGIHHLTESFHQSMEGAINLTAPHNFAYRYLPPIIYAFQQQYPQVEIHLQATNKACDLSKREADLAIRATPSPPDNLIASKLFSFAWSVYGTAHYCEQYGKPENSAQLIQHRMISAQAQLMHLPAYDWLEQNVVEENIIARGSDLMSIAALALTGIGLALLPDDQNKPELIKLCSIDMIPHSDIWVLSHPNMRECLRLKVFKQFVIDALDKDVQLQDNIYKPKA